MKRDKREAVSVQVFLKERWGETYINADGEKVSSKVYQMYYMAFITRSFEVVPMIDYRGETVKPYKYGTLNAVIDTILTIAKENNKRIPYYEEFGAKWYSILSLIWIVQIM